MSDANSDQASKLKPGASGRAPEPSGGGGDLPGDHAHSLETVYLLELMPIRDLATSLRLKPFRVVGDLIEMKLFKSPDDMIDFATASVIAQKHGYRAEKPPPGILVL